ncbi:hypothetical protein J2X66_003205 [Pseudomonas sp. 3296]|uniref:DUF3732 domain-containing protein n=1 Tax=Pseudomonas sp. 3296 TaxID=2817753 RepID=UPI00285FBEAA|nr:DUF3732 domain-containing protein [Pseudomonas sp. 3296]MDR6916336.1 hypothetical protein [Pseudomonas sp. 3296]
MKFGIDKIRLWSTHNETRDIEFKRGQINVLTGSSNRGKTSLLHIIDYCLLASEHKLPHDVINDNVSWYGIQFYINDKNYTIARKSPTAQKVSDQLYFSSIGALPEIPTPNAVSDDVKTILQSEFGLDASVVLYGGRGVKQGTQVSFRYFLLFNTISENIITNSDVYFDNQTKDRYRVALPRVLDLGLGVDNLENISSRERAEDLQRAIDKLEKKKDVLSNGRHLFESEARKIAASAAEYGLIDKVPKKVSIDFLKEVFDNDPTPDALGQDAKRLADAKAQLFEINRRMRRLREFSDEHKEYKATLKVTLDSLKPLETLLAQADQVLKTEIFDDLINCLTVDLLALKKSTASKQPADTQVSTMMRDLENQKKGIEELIESLPQKPKSFEAFIDLVRFVTRVKTQLETYGDVVSDDNTSYEGKIQELLEELESINVDDVNDIRTNTINQINDIALALLSEAAAAMDNYASYQVSFNYKDKKLQLRKPRSALVENVGSSSNHMFMHLFLFLALHEAAISKDSIFVPAFLFIDQPSRPYYGEEKITDESHIQSSDAAKISQVFDLLGNFVKRMKKTYGAEFQMIVLEHVPVTLFENVANVHVLPEFREDNALIPPSWKNRH